MNCEEIKDILPLYIEGLTDEQEDQMVEDHLKICPSCLNEKEEMESLQQKLRSIPSVVMPELLQNRMSDAIKEEANKIRDRKRRNRILRFSSIAAVFALGIFSFAMSSHLEDFFYQPVQTKEEAPAMMKSGEPLAEKENLEDAAPEQGQKIEAGAGTDAALKALPEARIAEGTETEAQEDPASIMTMTGIPQPVDPYLDLLAVELQGRDYRVLNWEEIQPEVFIIQIELADTNEKGESTWIPATYQGQEGKICRIESSS